VHTFAFLKLDALYPVVVGLSLIIMLLSGLFMYVFFMYYWFNTSCLQCINWLNKVCVVCITWFNTACLLCITLFNTAYLCVLLGLASMSLCITWINTACLICITLFNTACLICITLFNTACLICIALFNTACLICISLFNTACLICTTWFKTSVSQMYYQRVADVLLGLTSACRVSLSVLAQILRRSKGSGFNSS
jgi:hypothetical protein